MSERDVIDDLATRLHEEKKDLLSWSIFCVEARWILHRIL